ncbi:DinB family protein [Streptomyces sp. NRRL F-2799]|uniref:DinB family protein n=1 Tax=Streptomyces sp. NRRL F-2799 TaxID=1463844 RepID=UPI00068D368B|nr:DinB family protein [Streptomyces sp. NRRL F-2799]
MTVVVDAEITALLRFLQVQRNHVLGTVEGLSEEALRRPVLPSGWTCLGMVQHLTLSVERLYFRAAVAGDPEVIDLVSSQDSAWKVAAEVSGAEVIDRYRREASLADAVITASSADADLAWWPFPEGEWRLHNLREVLLHVIAETACHAGHLDAVRELIDGEQWLVNT